MNDSVAVAVSYLGKVKTTLQMIAIVLLLVVPVDSKSTTMTTGYVLLYLASIMTLWSMSQYLRAAWVSLKHGLGERR